MKLGDGLFLNTFRRVAEEYKHSGLEYNDMIVDNTYEFDVTRWSSTASHKRSTDPCNLSPDQANLTLWSCLICMVLSSPTLVQLWLVDLVSCQAAMLVA